MSRRSLGEGGRYKQRMKYVYYLRSLSNPDRYYVGQTDDIESRLAKHNEGGVTSTKANRPWELQTYIAFTEPEKALAFEKYLKSGSGRAFSKKRF